VKGTALINSPDTAVTLETIPGQQITSGAVVNRISIDNAALLGLAALAPGSHGSGPGQYLTCGSWVYSSNIKITNSVLTNIGSAAVNLEARDAQIINKTFQHNHATSPFNDIIVRVPAA
jgi:hypothetical protein